jgi:hypothetical protein
MTSFAPAKFEKKVNSTLWPAETNRRTIDLPMPELPPVTTTFSFLVAELGALCCTVEDAVETVDEASSGDSESGTDREWFVLSHVVVRLGTGVPVILRPARSGVSTFI